LLSCSDGCLPEGSMNCGWSMPLDSAREQRYSSAGRAMS
jgi:hypothetical protein